MGKKNPNIGNDLLFMVCIVLAMLIILVGSYYMNEVISNTFNITFE